MDHVVTRDHIVVLDGGTGAELQARGVAPDPICWHASAAITHPAELVSVHIDFINAGAQIITTNTFATHRYVLEATDCEGAWHRINSASVAAARRARTETGIAVKIAGSLSCMPPGFDTRNYPADTLARSSYTDQAQMLADLGVDIIALEMIQDSRHGGWALDAAIATGLPVWLGIACRLNQHGEEVVCFDQPDTTLDALLEELLDRAPQRVSIMHSPIEAIPTAFECVRRHWSGPIGVYPEVGSFDVVSRARTRKISPAAFSSAAQSWIAMGADVIGGCCGATPAHIEALTSELRR
jgi:homocysteine S-methyltransferase